MINGQELAFPLATEELSDRFQEGIDLEVGLTKREYFAVAAMEGILANPHSSYACATRQEISAMARDQADDLIIALKAT